MNGGLHSMALSIHTARAGSSMAGSTRVVLTLKSTASRTFTPRIRLLVQGTNFRRSLSEQDNLFQPCGYHGLSQLGQTFHREVRTSQLK